MDRNAEAITIFCSHLCVTEGVRPLEPKEWTDLAALLLGRNMQPGQLLDMDRRDIIETLGFDEDRAERLARLADRSGSLFFEVSKYADMGIGIVTRADPAYPKMLKKKLGQACPPLFYCAGDPAIAEIPAVGYVGSRDFNDDDFAFTKLTVAKTVKRGYAVVSGGAKGVDSAAAAIALSEGGSVVEYIADGMLRKLRDAATVREIRNGRVLMLSVTVPTAGFNAGIAMMRNRYIYAHSLGTVVVHADKGKGGTWAGATENLKKDRAPTFCRDCSYEGNRELIRLGAIPIDNTWPGDPTQTPARPTPPQQIGMFDGL